MTGLGAVYRRELAGYFATPVAYVLIFLFLFMSGLLTFYLGGFMERGQADLNAFSTFHPWIYLVFLPAIGMRLWAEERSKGTLEILLTLPIDLAAAVLGKFLAAWTLAAVALALTFPLWLTVAWLGDPDHGVIAAGYLGSLLLAGAYLAISGCLSALTRNQVIAFVAAVVICFLFTAAGAPIVLEFFSGWLPAIVTQTVASFSFLTHFTGISNGVIEARDLIFFLSSIVLWLFATALAIESEQAG